MDNAWDGRIPEASWYVRKVPGAIRRLSQASYGVWTGLKNNLSRRGHSYEEKGPVAVYSPVAHSILAL
jgi:hypothetical protein